MHKSEYLREMPTFEQIMMQKDRTVYWQDERLPHVIKEWAEFLIKQKQKGFSNLFLTGSGVSRSVVPDLIKIIRKLKEEYFKHMERDE
jgi:uncharacterized circularly permuted ATP-grasp superfamily protein